MEKERFFAGNWPSTDAMLPPGMNPGAGAEEMPHSFLNIGWEQPMHHDAHAHFESALSSLVSSPSSNTSAGNDSVVIRELINRLGTICNSGDISPSSRYHSADTSCYSTPLNSPPKLNLSGADYQQQGRCGLRVPGSQSVAAQFASFAADPAFAERGAAELSCFGPRTPGGLEAQLGLPESANLSRVSSSRSLMAANGKEVAIAGSEKVETERSKFGVRMPGSSSPEVSSASDRLTAGGGYNNGRKRKAAPKGKAKGAPLSSSTVNPPKEDNYDIKRCKPAETNTADKNEVVMPKIEPNSDRGSQKQGEENNVKPSEPPKDYIHVRARRGQATDSHSLAERVRREKISERMKLLQDLVPGCNKITGKAVMLDEIINYVQALQRQVEFLSMKLATLNPQLEFDMENLLPKDMNQTQAPLPQHVYSLDMPSSAFSYAQHPQGAPLQSAVTNGLEVQGLLNPLDSFLRRTSSLQLPPLDGFADAASQLGNMWEDDLQYFVQMGSGQSQGTAFTTSTTLRHE